ncbi:aminotransferase class V-fold PLP-dependent enzyme [Pseudidiomarina sp. 1APP75-32.1]|uniref:Probable cysteine desulfurase n=1 Tax=Pseudidiomarina terrestris TaxID=2820060 RepID=A0AAW7QXD0_9GAMM|nr:aminotransferase class V-fold PLP-dependent enzyme [Pseudidiomarina sp. 1APP75-32.1]MDN7123407.1 aminotransferase class V-fold PLP-dependent enzyme [Pseudidiomarina sp. 1APP75-32.1]
MPEARATGYQPPRDAFGLWQEQPELVYLDSAASCQVPEPVLQRYLQYYRRQHANVHRGGYPLAQQATQLLEQSRERLAHWIGTDAEHLVFTAGATHSLNLLATGLTIDWQAGDEIVVSRAEHHANFLPWQRLAERHQLKLRWLDLDPLTGGLPATWPELIGPRCKLLAVTMASNVTGQILPVAELCRQAAAQGAVSIIDAAQAVSSVTLDMAALQCDALTFSAHKMYGVTGCGVLYLSDRLQQQLQPALLGGGMVAQVSEAQSQWLTGVHKYEAGTPNTAAIVACAEAAEWLTEQRQKGLSDYLDGLTRWLVDELGQRSWIQLLPRQAPALPVLSFFSPEVHAYDLASFLAEQGIAVRAGSHCAQPLLQHWQHEAVVRVSLAAYTTRADCERLLAALDQAYQLFADA